ncbi:serine/threonine-protein phosphatase 7 long form like protein [Quercus suber]|uniref:Serine/threonine-protein phosphatase 7 long form like protein n=1 Tax=Quercus suber TaxID=58331 RepID=A0AAW0J9R8_QUESU
MQLQSMEPGPANGAQLTRQPMHRSTALWETPVGQVPIDMPCYEATTTADGCRWKGPKSTTEHATHVLAAYRASLSSMRAHQVVWEPYRDVLDSLPPYCTAGRHIWRATVPLIYFWIVEDHHPERVFRQFGMKQAPPGLVDTSVELHRISLQCKLETDWVQQHAIYIDRWAHRGERVANAPTLDGDTTYLAAYMAEYRRSTRRYITRESAYWEILLTKTLDLVGELNQVALDNVRAMASEASTHATSRGGRGGGSRGRGRSGGRGGRGGGPDIHIDDLDDEALEADWDTYMDGAGSSRCTSDATAQASHPVGHDDNAEHTSHAQARPRSPLPTPLSPPLFSGSAHEGGCIFVPTPGLPTPPVVQAKPTQEPSLSNLDEPAAQITPLSPPLFSGSAHEVAVYLYPPLVYRPHL